MEDDGPPAFNPVCMLCFCEIEQPRGSVFTCSCFVCDEWRVCGWQTVAFQSGRLPFTPCVLSSSPLTQTDISLCIYKLPSSRCAVTTLFLSSGMPGGAFAARSLPAPLTCPVHGEVGGSAHLSNPPTQVEDVLQSAARQMAHTQARPRLMRCRRSTLCPCLASLSSLQGAIFVLLRDFASVAFS